MSQKAGAIERDQQGEVQPHQLGQEVFKTILSEDVDWKPFPAFPPSVRLAVVVGRPSEPGPYTIRVKAPYGEKLMPHTHPEDRVYTVISGVFYIGLGDVFDASQLEAYPPGSVIVLPGNTPHFHWAKSGEYVTQVTAMGPLGLEYLNTKDDPRTNESKEPTMNSVQVEQTSYEMPPREGFTVTHFLTVADIDRSARFYETVFGGRIQSRGDSKGAPGYIQIANTWLIVNVGGGPTPDKPSVTLSVLADPDKISSFMNIRVADIQACYELWKSRGAEFITEPIPKYGEIRCYIRDPDGYIIEVGQSTELKYG